jgi:guanylate kinase
MNVTEILKASSLRGMISDMEINEIAEEITTEIEEIVEDVKEKAKDEAGDEIESLQEEYRLLEKEVENLKRTVPGSSTLEDSMTMEWITENWEDVKALYRQNIEVKELVNLAKNRSQSIDAVDTISKILNEEIIKTSKPVELLPSNTFSPKKHKRIVLVGRAASGKDHMRKTLEDKGFKYAVSYTTRPPRVGEVDGKDYFFLSVEEFEKMIQNGEFYEYVSFNNWYYGTTNAQFYNEDVFIMTPHGISHINPEDRKDTFIMYLDMKLGVRQRRLLQRSDADSVERRLAADDKDFSEFKNYDIRISNHDF